MSRRKEFSSGVANALAKAGITKKTIARKLLEVPLKDHDKPHQLVPKVGMIHQADLLFLPTDEYKKKKYKYALVVVDIANSGFDVEPLVSKESKAVTAAFQKIYSKNRRKIRKYPLTKPKLMMVTDDGSEFKGETAKYFKDRKIHLKYGKVGRSRQQAWAESRNAGMGKVLNTIMVQNEELTGKTDRDWVDLVPDVVNAMNQPEYLKKLYKPSDKPTKPNVPVCNPSDKVKGGKGKVNSCEIYPIGTRVRIIEDIPMDLDGSKLIGKRFRSGDRRWENRIRAITQIILKPKNPPLYIVTDMPKVAYTKAQLQLVTGDEVTGELVGPRAALKRKIPFKVGDRVTVTYTGQQGFNGIYEGKVVQILRGEEPEIIVEFPPSKDFDQESFFEFPEKEWGRISIIENNDANASPAEVVGQSEPRRSKRLAKKKT